MEIDREEAECITNTCIEERETVMQEILECVENEWDGDIPLFRSYFTSFIRTRERIMSEYVSPIPVPFLLLLNGIVYLDSSLSSTITVDTSVHLCLIKIDEGCVPPPLYTLLSEFWLNDVSASVYNEIQSNSLPPLPIRDLDINTFFCLILNIIFGLVEHSTCLFNSNITMDIAFFHPFASLCSRIFNCPHTLSSFSFSPIPICCSLHNKPRKSICPSYFIIIVKCKEDELTPLFNYYHDVIHSAGTRVETSEDELNTIKYVVEMGMNPRLTRSPVSYVLLLSAGIDFVRNMLEDMCNNEECKSVEMLTDTSIHSTIFNTVYEYMRMLRETEAENIEFGSLPFPPYSIIPSLLFDAVIPCSEFYCAIPDMNLPPSDIVLWRCGKAKFQILGVFDIPGDSIIVIECGGVIFYTRYAPFLFECKETHNVIMSQLCCIALIMSSIMDEIVGIEEEVFTYHVCLKMIENIIDIAMEHGKRLSNKEECKYREKQENLRIMLQNK